MKTFTILKPQPSPTNRLKNNNLQLHSNNYHSSFTKSLSPKDHQPNKIQVCSNQGNMNESEKQSYFKSQRIRKLQDTRITSEQNQIENQKYTTFSNKKDDLMLQKKQVMRKQTIHFLQICEQILQKLQTKASNIDDNLLIYEQHYVNLQNDMKAQMQFLVRNIEQRYERQFIAIHQERNQMKDKLLDDRQVLTGITLDFQCVKADVEQNMKYIHQQLNFQEFTQIMKTYWNKVHFIDQNLLQENINPNIYHRRFKLKDQHRLREYSQQQQRDQQKQRGQSLEKQRENMINLKKNKEMYSFPSTLETKSPNQKTMKIHKYFNVSSPQQSQTQQLNSQRYCNQKSNNNNHFTFSKDNYYESTNNQQSSRSRQINTNSRNEDSNVVSEIENINESFVQRKYKFG